MMHSILKLDAAGNPVGWINYEKAAYYVTKDLVLWELGGERKVLHGGHNEQGVQSVLELPFIMAIRGKTQPRAMNRTIPLEKEYVLKRDRYTCAYCGTVHNAQHLELEHILPEARGGLLEWTNIVASCHGCNARKGCKTPEEAGMPLLYVPYVPNMHEGLILQGRRILADQMEFLSRGLPKHSRMRDWGGLN